MFQDRSIALNPALSNTRYSRFSKDVSVSMLNARSRCLGHLWWFCSEWYMKCHVIRELTSRIHSAYHITHAYCISRYVRIPTRCSGTYCCTSKKMLRPYGGWVCNMNPVDQIFINQFIHLEHSIHEF
jgi:hypothetical protein